MAYKYMERCSISWAIRGMLIKTTVGYVAPTRMVKIKNLPALSVDKDVEELELTYIVGVKWYDYLTI